MTRTAQVFRFALCCTVLLLAISGSAQEPRAVFFAQHSFPVAAGAIDADLRTAARPIFADSKTLITDAQEATSDGNDLPMTCAGNTSGDHAVWFTFNNPTNSWIQLDTYGSNYDAFGPNFTRDTVMALYNAGNTEVACNDDAGPGLQSSFIYGYFPAGTYRVQVANGSGTAATNDSVAALEFELSVQGLSVMLGDDFPEALALNLGGAGTTVIHDWGYNDSSMEALPDSCFDEASVATNRLGSRDYWYTFTLTNDTIVTLDPAGSQDNGSSALDTLVSVHQAGHPDTSQTLLLQGCIDNSQVDVQEALTIDLAPGKYYVRLAGAKPLGEAGTNAYVLKAFVNPVRNGGFEDGNFLRAVNPAPWVFKNKKGDKIDCEHPLPYDGNCVLKLKGGANEKFKAKQTLNVADIDFSAATQVSMSAQFKSDSAATMVTITLKLKFSTGGTAVTISQNGSTGGDWTEATATGVTILNSENISSAKLLIKNKSTGGTAYVDNVRVEFGEVFAGPRAAGALPLPDAP